MRKLCAAALLAALLAGPSGSAVAQQFTQPATSRAPVAHGTIVAHADSSAVFAAELRTVSGRVLGRTNAAGRFSIMAARGDTVVVRALGFRVNRVVIQRDSQTIVLDAAATVLPAFMTTTGQRTIRAGEATTKATILTRADIEASAAISANQLLRQVPGLQEIAAPPSKSSIAIRGFDASRVLVLVDGEPVSGALIESRDIGRLSTVAAERIEVTKGPSSAEFGSDALGGVINLVTAAPTREFSADATLREGELGRRESTVGISQTIGRFGYRVSGGWRQIDRVAAIDAAGATFERVYDARSSLRYRLSDNVSLRADLQGAKERQRWPVGGGYNGFIDNESAQGFLDAEWNTLGGVLHARAFAQQFDYQYRQSQQLLPISGSGDLLEQREQLQRYLASYSRAVGRHTFDAGAQTSARNLVSPGKISGDSASERLTEVFARDAWNAGPVLATVGARYSTSSLWGNTLNPTAGVAWQAADAWRLRANIGRGFRAPGFKDVRYTFANPAAGYTVVGNDNLKPESSVSSSIGATWVPAARLTVDVEAYRNDVKDLIDTRFQRVNAAGLQVYQNVNVARARTQGLESSVTLIDGAWNVTASYAYLHARDRESGLALSQRAANTARLGLEREFRMLAGVVFDATARYTGASDVVGAIGDSTGVTGKQGAFLSVDAQARVKITHKLEISGGVNNALDQRPMLWGAAYERQYYAALRLRW